MKKTFCSCLLVIVAIWLFSSPGVADTIRYQYDETNRLKKVEKVDNFHVEYEYDGVGNRIAKTVQQTTSRFDIDHDKDVDGKDLQSFITTWHGDLEILADFANFFGMCD